MSNLKTEQPTVWVVIQNGKVLGTNDEPGELHGIAAIPYRPQIQPDTAPIDLGDVELPAGVDWKQRAEDYAYEINKLRNVIQSACIGGTDSMLKRWVELFPDAPVPTVTAPLIFPHPLAITRAMTEQAKARTSPENIADVLLAIAQAHQTAQEAS